MLQPSPSPGFACVCLLVLVIGGSWPAPAAAGSIGFYNGTNLVVMVQGSTVDNQGRVRCGQPHKINPKETAWDQVAAAGPKTIVIYNPRQPNQVYFQGVINFGGKDELYAIQPDVGGKAPGIKVARVPLPAMPRK